MLNSFLNSFALGLGGQELLIIFVLILLLFGGTKIPQLMRGVGRGVGELQKGLEEGKRAFNSSADDEPRKETETPKDSAK